MQVYKFGYNYNISFFLSLFFIMIFIIMGMAFFFSTDKKILKLLIMIIFVGMFSFVVYSLYIHPFSNYRKIKKAIENNEILYVSGEVTEFKTPSLKWGNHESESFKINDIEFEYLENESYGYAKIAKNNGIINKNGQKLKIGYYEEYEYYDKSKPSRRVIVSIEILNSDWWLKGETILKVVFDTAGKIWTAFPVK